MCGRFTYRAPAGGKGAMAERFDSAESGTVESSAQRPATRALGAGARRTLLVGSFRYGADRKRR
jgi:hypothetical protein